MKGAIANTVIISAIIFITAGVSLGHFVMGSNNDSSLSEGTESLFSDGNTFEKIVAWNECWTSLPAAYESMVSSYQEGNMTSSEFLMAKDLFCQQLPQLKQNLEEIKVGAGFDLNPYIDKLEEAVDWDIKGYDNYALHITTGEDSYLELARNCWDERDLAKNESFRINMMQSFCDSGFRV
jgi:hypothetical protein